MKIKQVYANIGKLITSSLELHKILEGIMKEVAIAFSPQNWSLLRLDPLSKELFFVIVEGENAEKIKNIRIKKGEGIAGTVVQTEKSIFVPDAANDPRFSDRIDKLTGFQTISVLAVPIICYGVLYGVIELINRFEDKQFTEDDHLMLKTIADFSAIAFANSSFFQRIVSISFTDPLTGVFNRTKLNRILDKAKEKSQRRRKDDKPHYNISVFVIDLDHFKEINDNFGHQEGDRILRHTAKLLHSIVRDEDMIFRIGGDEFLVLLPENNTSLVDEFEKRLERCSQEFTDSMLKENITISLSYGAANGPEEQLKELIHEADLNMYENKKNRKEKQS